MTRRHKGKGLASKSGPSSYTRKHGVSFRDVASVSPTHSIVSRRAPTPFKPTNHTLSTHNAPLIIPLDNSSFDCEDSSDNNSDISYESLDSVYNLHVDNYSILNEELNFIQDHDDLLPLHDYGLFDSNENQEYRVREAGILDLAESDHPLPNQEEFENSAYVYPCFYS